MSTEEPAATPAAEPAPSATSNGDGPSIGIGLVVVVIGALMLIGSSFMAWLENEAGENLKGTEIGAEFLVDNTDEGEDPSLVVPLAIAAVVAGVGGLLRKRLIAIVGGVLGVVIVGLFYYQVDDLGVDVFDVIAAGFWVALAGSIAAIVGSLLPQES
jgi:hypothetical protein